MTLAAGLACESLKPVVAIYSTFLQRAYDQLIHDVALQKLPVLFAIDRAGIVGPDGATHAGSFDLSYLRCIPNMMIMAPANENECRQLLSTGFEHNGPAAVRYPRGQGLGIEVSDSLAPLPVGKGQQLREGESVAILSFGNLLSQATQAADVINASLANMRFIKPLDEELILHLVKNHEILVTIEDNAALGGAGSAVTEFLSNAGLKIPVLTLGLPDQFLTHGTQAEILAEAELSADGIIRRVEAFLRANSQVKHTTQAPLFRV